MSSTKDIVRWTEEKTMHMSRVVRKKESRHNSIIMNSPGQLLNSNIERQTSLKENVNQWFTEFTRIKKGMGNLSVSTLYLFPLTNPFRLICLNVCMNKLYMTLLDILVLIYNMRMVYLCYHEIKESNIDHPYSIFTGCLLLIDIFIKTVAFGFIGHINSYLLRDHFSIFECALGIIFFIDGISYMQAFQLFRIVSIMTRPAFMKSFANKLHLIKKSLLSLGIFVAIYMVLLFLFTLLGYLMFHDYMSSYCVLTDPSVPTVFTKADVGRSCEIDQPCDPGFTCMRLTVDLRLN